MQDPAMLPLLALDQVSKRYGEQYVLQDVSLTVQRGETVAIIGPSGSGKTTLLRCVNFLVPYDQGTIRINGKLIGYREEGGKLTRESERNVCDMRKSIGMVFQRFNLFPHRSVLGNLLEGPLYVLKVPRTEATTRAEDALRTVDLLDKRDDYPDQLSGGQQQRVAIARALCMQPELMLFDEVTSALDPELVGEVLATMRLLADRGMTMLVVTHELQFAREAANRVVFMERGKVVAEDDARSFFEKPASPRIESFIRRTH